MLHISLHFIIPAIVVALFFRQQWGKAFLIMASTILVDIDHLLATPVYDAMRCSIGFHPLHQWPPIVGYALLTLHPVSRLIGLGLLIHMSLDSIDCVINTGYWSTQTV